MPQALPHTDVTAWQTHDLPFDPEQPQDVQRFKQREWLLTGGDGSFAMGTALGCNTRRYHGLLIAAATPPVQRVLVLNQLFETLVLTDPNDGSQQRVEFSTNAFLDEQQQPVYAPLGFAHLERVTRGVGITWHYRWGQHRWYRQLDWQPNEHGNPGVAVTYTLDPESPHDPALREATLELAPMLTLRDFHALHHGDPVQPLPASDSTAPTQTFLGQAGQATLTVPGSTYHAKPHRWQDVHYAVDAYRGQADREHLDVPGTFTAPFSPDQQVTLHAAWAGRPPNTHADHPTNTTPLPPRPHPTERHQQRHALRTHIVDLVKRSGIQTDPLHPLANALTLAADDFVVQRTATIDGQTKALTSIVAGYPWFADWGRDTFIALPGLLLCTGRFDQALETLELFARSLQNGIVPNRFDDANPDAMHFNTVDGSMWFAHAALTTAQTLISANRTVPNWLGRAIAAVLDAHLEGTQATDHELGQWRSIPITCDTDGLLTAGDDHTQLTWMDAACDLPDGTHAVFTPRPGKCVEVNALWHSNLRAAVQLAPQIGINALRARTYRATAENAGFALATKFWSDELNRLHDHLRPDGTPNSQHRPNATLAVSLAHCPWNLEQRNAVLDAAQRELLTPAGLRTLAPNDPQFQPAYAGPAHQRDAAYHQGTVWPWLLGAYAEGRLRAGRGTPQAANHARQAIAPLLQSLVDPEQPHAALGQLHEIHDAQPQAQPKAQPHHLPRGCIAQAWSVAELLRVLALLSYRPTLPPP